MHENSTEMSQDDAAAPRGGRRRSRVRRIVLFGLIATAALLVTGELTARFALGLGDPPLSITDPDMEYRFAPGRVYSRFGNRVAYNQWSMRSGPMPREKTDPDAFRVLVMGDSVVNGGSLTDQADLATTILETELAATLDRPVRVGNVSAGSWGVDNLAAYARKFGLFDADVVVIVLSDHDAWDTMTFEPIVGKSPNFPDRTPILALWEGVTRYLPRYLPQASGEGESEAGTGTSDETPKAEPPDPQAIAAYRDLIAMAQEAGAEVITVLHHTRDTLDRGPEDPPPGLAAFRDAALAHGVEVLWTAEQYAPAIEAGRSPFLDNIHISRVGQHLLADLLMKPLSSRGGLPGPSRRLPLPNRRLPVRVSSSADAPGGLISGHPPTRVNSRSWNRMPRRPMPR